MQNGSEQHGTNVTWNRDRGCRGCRDAVSIFRCLRHTDHSRIRYEKSWRVMNVMTLCESRWHAFACTEQGRCLILDTNHQNHQDLPTNRALLLRSDAQFDIVACNEPSTTCRPLISELFQTLIPCWFHVVFPSCLTGSKHRFKQSISNPIEASSASASGLRGQKLAES